MASSPGSKDCIGLYTIDIMTQEQEKPHWNRLKDILQQSRNGRARIYWQDGLPVSIEDIETNRKKIDLTQNTD